MRCYSEFYNKPVEELSNVCWKYNREDWRSIGRYRWNMEVTVQSDNNNNNNNYSVSIAENAVARGQNGKIFQHNRVLLN